ncbi:hypothetical protein BD410DRAFT_805366 [Rickenella mellea]|uniref:Arrestin-like N-terminal domain-containing protein n=1 Tax=Rickenella mellea TaxID=50990 RepID=A0A4Y7PYC9_9AGAM|nr:hypothetical protein BD410DRAFT_805366 [Rickenella mellea]
MAQQPESTDLPQYSPHVAHEASAFVEHTFTSGEDGKDKPALTLKVQSRAPSVKYLPTFLGGEPVVGSVELNLPKAVGIESVILMFKGIMETASVRNRDPLTFFKLHETLWDASKGDPKNFSSGNNKDIKLRGEYTWKFSVNLPKEVTFDDENKYKEMNLAGTLPLPPQFSEKGSFSTMKYEMAVLVNHSSFFRSNQEVGTRYGYTPRSKPGPPSPLRQKAYSEGVPLLGPDADPEGWKIFSVDVQGKLFDAVDVGVKCSLALATPLAYTHGSVLPCVLILEGNNTQAIDILSDVKSPSLGLFREFKTEWEVNQIGSMWGGTMEEWSSDDDRRVADARWWKPNDSLAEGSESKQRILHGEINIPLNIQPSFSFGNFFAKYRVELDPFKAAGFVAETKEKLLKVDVQITTDYAAGPKPKSYLPPAYN